ncbi:MAG: aminotransferase class I/II-fold pyridoxal phosphate-dependent enzyme [Bacteroidota bacterium]
MDQRLIQKLNNRKEEGTLRSLLSFEGMIDFHSNDYLGLAKVPTEIQSNQFGSTGSRLISGSSNAALACERFLANFFQSESALVFNSGYDANLGFFSSVPQKGDTVLYDEFIHASVRDGLRLSFAKSLSFRHNDVADLKQKLEKCEDTIYVAVESLYSMHGDLAPLSEIAALCKQKSAYLIVDEAHSAGVFGKQGRGLVDELELGEKVFARLITFGKAYGSHGAVILGSDDLKQYLINFARSFIYSTALPPESYERIVQMVNYAELPQLQAQLQNNIALFRSQFEALNLLSASTSPIQSLRFNSRENLITISDKCIAGGLAVKAVFSPTVPEKDECLRVNLHSFQRKKEIEVLKGCVFGK